MEKLHLIVGLGNPGAEYSRTRHNAGFLVLDRLAERWRSTWTLERRFSCRMARADVGGAKVLLCQPQTFMNSSGESVSPLAAFYRIPLSAILVVVDDADLPLGEIRLRPRGSSGGHHGLESIEAHAGTRDFARLRVGIGRLDCARQITNYVLGRFSNTEMGLAEQALTAAASQAECWLTAGIEKAMNRFNGRVEELKGDG